MKIRKFRDNQLEKVFVPDHISDQDLSTTIDVLTQIGDVRVMAWIIENLDALKLSDRQIEALCSKRPLTIKMRQNLARYIKSTASANNLKTGCTSLSFRIEFLKNQHLTDSCKKSCLTKSNIKLIIEAREYSEFHLNNLKGKLPNQIWEWLDSQKSVKDIIL